MAYLVHLLTVASLYVVLAVSLDLLVGVTGLLSLAHAAFFGVGAYATALLAGKGLTPIPAMCVGAAVAAFGSILIALPAVRVRGIYLLIVTIAVQVVFTVALSNWSDLTGGPAGIPNIPPLTVFGRELRGVEFLCLTGVTAALVTLVCWRLKRSPYGFLLQAIRDDEVGCFLLGKNVLLAKLSVFAFSGALAAVAGSLYAHYASYVDPRGFDILVSVSVLLMVMLGGAGTIYGPVAGALVLTLLPEFLRFLPLPPGAAAASRQLIYGFLLVCLVFVRPQGLLGRARVRDHAH